MNHLPALEFNSWKRFPSARIQVWPGLAFLLEALGGNLFPGVFQFPAASRIPWLMVPFLQHPWAIFLMLSWLWFSPCPTWKNPWGYTGPTCTIHSCRPGFRLGINNLNFICNCHSPMWPNSHRFWGLARGYLWGAIILPTGSRCPGSGIAGS